MPFLNSIEGTYGFGKTVPPAAAPASTAALYYDASDSSSYSGSGTTLTNIGNGGAMAGTMSSVTFTSAGTASYLSFNGTSSAISFNSFNFTNTVTVSAWVNATSKYSINTLIANAAPNTNTNGFKIHWNSWNTTNNHLLIEAGNGSTGGASTSGTAVVVPGTWQYLTWVWDVTNRIIRFYNNGTLIATANPAATPTNPNMNQAWRIGSMAGSYLMSGRLGYMKVWTSILSASDITTDYTNSRARFGV
jgi:uncharacterized membrane protein